MHPRRDAIGRRPDLPITNDGAVKCRLLGSTAVVNPGSDAARRGLVLDATTDLSFVQALQDDFQRRWSQRSRHGASLSSFPVNGTQDNSVVTSARPGTRAKVHSLHQAETSEVEMARAGVLWLVGYSNSHSLAHVGVRLAALSIGRADSYGSV